MSDAARPESPPFDLTAPFGRAQPYDPLPKNYQPLFTDAVGMERYMREICRDLALPDNATNKFLDAVKKQANTYMKYGSPKMHECAVLAAVWYTGDTRKYTDPFFSRNPHNVWQLLNDGLVNQLPNQLQSLFPFLYYLKEALSKLPRNDKPLVVWRGFNVQLSEATADTYAVSSTLTWPAVTSATEARETATDFLGPKIGTLMQIIVDVGLAVSMTRHATSPLRRC